MSGTSNHRNQRRMMILLVPMVAMACDSGVEGRPAQPPSVAPPTQLELGHPPVENPQEPELAEASCDSAEEAMMLRRFPVGSAAICRPSDGSVERVRIAVQGQAPVDVPAVSPDVMLRLLQLNYFVPGRELVVRTDTLEYRLQERIHDTPSRECGLFVAPVGNSPTRHPQHWDCLETQDPGSLFEIDSLGELQFEAADERTNERSPTDIQR